MAILKSAIIQGSARILGKLYCNDIGVSGIAEFGAITAYSLTSTGTLSVTGASTLTGAVTAKSTVSATGNISSSGTVTGATGLISTNGNVTLAGKKAMSVNGTKLVLATDFSDGVSLGAKNLSTTGNITATTLATTTFTANTITATNMITSPKWEIDSVANLGGTFMVAPTIYFSQNAVVAVGTVTSTTMSLTITDTSNDSPFNGITSENKLAGTTWFANAKVKFSGTINGVGFTSADGIVSAQMTASNKRIQL